MEIEASSPCPLALLMGADSP